MPPTKRYTPDEGNLLLGKGEVYFDRFDDNGVKTGERHIGNCHSLEITNEDDVAESYSGMNKEAELYARTVKRRKQTAKINFEEIVAENMALLAMGAVTTVENTDVTPVADEAIGAVLKGRYYKVLGRKISYVSVVYGTTLIGAADAYEDEDFAVDERTGRIYIMPGGAIDDGDKVWVSYTPGAYSYEAVTAGTKGEIIGSLRFVPDPTEGPQIELEAWKVAMSADSALQLITEDYAQMSLAAQFKTDRVNHPNEPYYRLTYLS